MVSMERSIGAAGKFSAQDGDVDSRLRTNDGGRGNDRIKDWIPVFVSGGECTTQGGITS